MALEVGTRLGHYDVTALIGEGGMGEVYQARETKLRQRHSAQSCAERSHISLGSGQWRVGRVAELTDVFYSQAGLYSSDPRACLSAPALSKADPRPRGAPPQSYAGIERDRDTGICHTLAGVVVGRMEAIESFISALASS